MSNSPKDTLSTQKGAAANPGKRGNFITAQTYDSLEFQCHTATDCQVGCIFSMQMVLGKSVHLNQEQSIAEVVDRAAKIQQNIEAMHSLAQHRIAPPSLSNRKKTFFTFVNHIISCDYKYPPSYSKFKQELCDAFQRRCEWATFYALCDAFQRGCEWATFYAMTTRGILDSPIH